MAYGGQRGGLETMTQLRHLASSRDGERRPI